MRVGSLSLLQRIFPTQELNQGLLHCSQILYQLRHQGSPLQGKFSLTQIFGENFFHLDAVLRELEVPIEAVISIFCFCFVFLCKALSV